MKNKKKRYELPEGALADQIIYSDITPKSAAELEEEFQANLIEAECDKMRETQRQKTFAANYQRQVRSRRWYR